jgi:hypothetical protein
VEPEPRLRAIAHTAAADAPVPVEVVDGLADRFPVADHCVDAAVFCLVPCSVPDPLDALRGAAGAATGRAAARAGARARRQARRGPGVAAAGRHDLAGARGRLHASRDTAADIERAGFTIDRLDRFLFPQARTPFSFHILADAHTR